jgi:hypothetical protein
MNMPPNVADDICDSLVARGLLKSAKQTEE